MYGKEWNPTKVMPETWMPVAGWIAANFIYPLCGDFAFALTVVSAIIITILIISMCICFQKLVISWFDLSIEASWFCEMIFLLLHFMIFRNRGGSQCMFTVADLNCIYNYTMSGILNASIVLVFFRGGRTRENCEMDPNPIKHNIKRLFWGTLIYFALLSNLFHSAITAIGAGIFLLADWQCLLTDWKKYFKNNMKWLLLVVIWFGVLLFEANGGRAGSYEGIFDLVLSMKQLIALVVALSKPFILFAVIAGITMFCLLRQNKETKNIMRERIALIIGNGFLLTFFY